MDLPPPCLVIGHLWGMPRLLGGGSDEPCATLLVGHRTWGSFAARLLLTWTCATTVLPLFVFVCFSSLFKRCVSVNGRVIDQECHSQECHLSAMCTQGPESLATSLGASAENWIGILSASGPK